MPASPDSRLSKNKQVVTKFNCAQRLSRDHGKSIIGRSWLAAKPINQFDGADINSPNELSLCSLTTFQAVATALQDLAEQLIFGQVRSDGVEGRAAQATLTAKRMAIAALLALKHNCALTFKRGAGRQDTFEG